MSTDKDRLIDRLRRELRRYAEQVDDMSYHGEQITCTICGATGIRGGFKRGYDKDHPIVHENYCPLSEEFII